MMGGSSFRETCNPCPSAGSPAVSAGGCICLHSDGGTMLLLLDEPTNDLDISRSRFWRIISRGSPAPFGGLHDRFFLDRLAGRCLRSFPGTSGAIPTGPIGRPKRQAEVRAAAPEKPKRLRQETSPGG